MKMLKVLVVLFIITLTASIALAESLDGDEIFQVSVIDALGQTNKTIKFIKIPKGLNLYTVFAYSFAKG